jgi:hypothetical protein
MIRYGKLIEEDTWDPKEIAKKAIRFEAADMGKLTICSNENLLHYLTKAMLVYYLKRLHHRCSCEVEVVGCGVGDVFDHDTNVLYELESEQYTSKIMRRKDKFLQAGVDLVIIKLPLHTMDFGEIAEYVKRYIRPD